MPFARPGILRVTRFTLRALERWRIDLEMERRFGTSPVVIDFRAGKGRVLHLLGHFYQKDGNRLGLVAMDNLILNYLTERFPPNKNN